MNPKTNNRLDGQAAAKLRRWAIAHEAAIQGMAYPMVAKMATQQLGFFVTKANAQRAMKDMGIVYDLPAGSRHRLPPSRVLAAAVLNLADALGHRFDDELTQALVRIRRGQAATGSAAGPLAQTPDNNKALT